MSVAQPGIHRCLRVIRLTDMASRQIAVEIARRLPVRIDVVEVSPTDCQRPAPDLSALLIDVTRETEVNNVPMLHVRTVNTAVRSEQRLLSNLASAEFRS
jgi:hypothetical protein